ncbi:universal stress protein [Kribbella qitaiheensis]|uniref:universal stress protein n=1 Tax=Kribbella qitaiheensis TaxID=1544730 RepID=UPI00162655D0|nr:universal stress protein [Kribbella qitaiheensis]
MVVEVEGTVEGLRVVDYACEEAMRAGVSLVLARPYSAQAPFSPMMPLYAPSSPADLADAELRVAVAHVRQRVGESLPVTAVSSAGSRTAVLSRLARNARLLVVGRVEVRVPFRFFTTPTAVGLAVRAGCPVVVVPKTWKPSMTDRTIAVGVDGTALSWEAVGFAFRTAAEREARLITLHAEQVLLRWTLTDDDGGDTWVARADLTLAETLAGWAEQYPEVTVTRMVTADPVVTALAREGRAVGLLVLGVHGAASSGTDRVAQRVVATADCPVALVPHEVSDAEYAAHQTDDETLVFSSQ